MYELIVPQGINFKSKFGLTPEELSEILRATVAFVQGIEPPGTVLHHYADWWEHDGLHWYDGSIDFDALSLIVASPHSLKDASPNEYNVFIGIAPQNFGWYLRFYYDEYDKKCHRFDITLPDRLATQYRHDIIKPLGLDIQEQDATGYYKQIIKPRISPASQS